MPEQFGDKTHDATPHRRRQARQEGQVAKSQDLVSAVTLVGAAAALLVLGGALVAFLGELTESQLGQVTSLSTDAEQVASQSRVLLWELARTVLPIIALIAALGVVANLVQTGLLFVPGKAKPDWSRVSPLKGLKRLFSISNVMRLGFGIFKVAIIAVVALLSLWGRRQELANLGALEVGQIAVFLTEITLWTVLKIGIALLVLAILDFAFQRWKHSRDLRMTDQEMREEMKTTQGDPQIMARRRAVQRQLALNRLSADVPQADVVVTNPTELAIAIRYDSEKMAAPIVLAKGAGEVAAQIRRLALEHNIPVVERKPLAQALYKHVEVGQPIPSEQYAAMAEVLKYVYELKGNLPKALRKAS